MPGLIKKGIVIEQNEIESSLSFGEGQGVRL